MQKRTAITIIAVFYILSIIVSAIIGYNIKRCNPCENSTVVVSVKDSIAPNKDTAISINFKPKKVGTKKYNPSASDSIIDLVDTIKQQLAIGNCLDTNLFQFDTISVDNFRATAHATVSNNEILNMDIEWRNLKPEKWKIMTKTVTVQQKQALVKVYTGFYAGCTIANKTVASYHGGIGLDAVISDRHLIGLQGGLNSMLQPEVGVRFSEKIRLKK